MTQIQRTECRYCQDFLLMLAVDMSGYDELLAVCEGGPTLRQLRGCIWPEWQFAIVQAIKDLAVQHNVSVPNFAQLAARAVAA